MNKYCTNIYKYFENTIIYYLYIAKFQFKYQPDMELIPYFNEIQKALHSSVVGSSDQPTLQIHYSLSTPHLEYLHGLQAAIDCLVP